jgi:hypothetical protein
LGVSFNFFPSDGGTLKGKILVSVSVVVLLLTMAPVWNLALSDLSVDQKYLLFFNICLWFFLNQSAICGGFRIKKAVAFKVSEKMMSKQGHAIIKPIKNKNF